MSRKEARYRQLLALYPGEFRREYEQEMLGVLMADPRPARSHTVNLLAGAMAARLRPVFADPAWRRAARAAQLFGAILLCAISMRRLATAVVAMLRLPAGYAPPVDVLDVVRVVAWAAVIVSALAGVRAVGVPAALAGLGVEIVAPFRLYAETPATVLDSYWIVVAAVVVLVAATVSAGGPRPRGWLPVASTGVLLVGGGFVPWRLGGPYLSAWRLTSLDGPYLLRLLPVLAAGLLLAWAVQRLEPPVRRRLVACAVPVLGAFPLVAWGFGGFVKFNMGHPENLRLLSPGQWAALALIPVLAFGVAAWLNMRLERTRAVSAGEVPEM